MCSRALPAIGAYGAEERIVSVDTGLPVVRLDDLVVVLRQMQSGPDVRFGCLIAPTPAGLARLQTFLQESGKSCCPAAGKAWLDSLRSQLGQQDIEVYGLDPRTRAARVMVEADYRMKLVGMGLEAGVPGVPSYLAMIRLGPRQTPPPMGVLRWWFELNYDAVAAAKDRSAFALRGQGVKVLSENEHLTAQGQRVHTGESDDLNREFAPEFHRALRGVGIQVSGLRRIAEPLRLGAGGRRWFARNAWQSVAAGT